MFVSQLVFGPDGPIVILMGWANMKHFDINRTTLERALWRIFWEG